MILLYIAELLQTNATSSRSAVQFVGSCCMSKQHECVANTPALRCRCAVHTVSTKGVNRGPMRAYFSAQAGECRGGCHQPPSAGIWGEAPEIRRKLYKKGGNLMQITLLSPVFRAGLVRELRRENGLEQHAPNSPNCRSQIILLAQCGRAGRLSQHWVNCTCCTACCAAALNYRREGG
jgi:hypothetical protein